MSLPQRELAAPVYRRFAFSITSRACGSTYTRSAEERDRRTMTPIGITITRTMSSRMALEALILVVTVQHDAACCDRDKRRAYGPQPLGAIALLLLLAAYLHLITMPAGRGATERLMSLNEPFPPPGVPSQIHATNWR
jgi:hypothetical protein